MAETNYSAPATGVLRKNARKICACKACGAMFKPKGTTLISFCSRECAFAYKATSPSCTVYAGYCLGCGKPFVSRRKRLHCSETCWAPSAWVSIAPDSRECKACGASYKPTSSGGRPSEYCGIACSEAVKSARKRIEKSKRKALLRGVTVESVDPFKVFDRDKWRCQLCGVTTPKVKRGTYDGNAPELDHIIPLARGGEHSYINTQCTCRKCNGLKSDTPMGQLLMFG